MEGVCRRGRVTGRPGRLHLKTQALGMWRWLWARIAGENVDRTAASLLAIFRFTSWALTSLTYVVASQPVGIDLGKVVVIAGVFVVGAVVTTVLNRITSDPRQILTLALAEAVGLPLLLISTGGLASPFVWNALNPLLIAAVYLPLGYTWGIVSAFVATAYAAMQVFPHTRGHLLVEYSDVLLILALVAVVIRLQASQLRTMDTQAREIQRQQSALQEAYDDLAVRGEALEALSRFQREIISCIGHSDLYWTVVQLIQRRFEPQWTAVLYPVGEPEPDLVECAWLAEGAGCRQLTAGAFPGFDWASGWQQAEYSHLRLQQDLSDPTGDATATPLLVDNGRIRALLAVGGLAAERRVELQIWLEYVRQLAAKLTAAERTRRTLDYLGNVQQLVEGAGITREEGDLIDLVTLFAQQLTGAVAAAFWPADPAEPDVLRVAPSIVHAAPEAPPIEDFAGHAVEWWASSPGALAGLDRYPDNGQVRHVCRTVVRSTERRFGVLLVVGSRPFSDDIDVVRTMGFLGYLAGAMLERQEAEGLHGRLLVAEEQSRIAAEIHDGVSQSLFSLVYGLQGAIQSLGAGKLEDTSRTLGTLRDVAAKVSREIRSSIYQLAQGGDRGTFVRAIRACLDDVEALYGVNTALEVTGSEDNLSPALKRAVYRIVREATSNAARHGQASRLQVTMALTPQQTVLAIGDNGVGFVPPALDPVARQAAAAASGSRTGLGILNMTQLARSFNGSIAIDSAPGRGTLVTVKIPDLAETAENGG